MKTMIVKRIILGFILMLSIHSYAQKLKICSECDTEKYEITDIINNELHELKLLRNEIYARHQYIFEDSVLETYFENFDWYKPDYKNKASIHFNTIEQHNIALFKKRENELKKQRVTLINELKKFKKALSTNDKAYIEKVLFTKLKRNDIPYYDYLLNTLKRVLSKIPLDEINWHKNNAKYSIEIDNGFSISSEGIHISKNEITIELIDPQTSSSLMEGEAFTYPSMYESESETSLHIIFIIKNKKLVLIRTWVAG